MIWLDEWPMDASVAMESFVEFFVLVQVVALALMVLLLALSGPWFHWRVRRRRSFWCSQAQRPVEVEFEEHGVPGIRCTARVLTCSAFESPEAIACARRCRWAAFRRQWEPALPVFGLGTS
jgi:hypothetical protein